MENTNNEELLEEKVVNVMTNPTTGEQIIIGDASEEEFNKSFNDMIEKINNDDDVFGIKKPISEKDMIEYIANESSDSPLFKVAKNDTGLSDEDTRKILEIANRRINNEKFNVYKEYPDSVKAMVDRFIGSQISASKVMIPINRAGEIRKQIAEDILDEFISDINLNRAKSDFALELQQIYESANKELSEASLEYMDERNKEYRKMAEEIEDEEKKEKLKSILDRIDEARALTELKEFAKTCKIKAIEIRKANTRVYSGFLAKYIKSTNNIYDINLARTILARHLAKDGYDNPIYADMFLILFCKQVVNYEVNNPLEHAYMYYVLYYCAMLDSDKSETFKKNVEEVIDISKERNKQLLV